ncbi:MAG: hypothetical protein AAF662_02345 [Pseudomonadota bacterium]
MICIIKQDQGEITGWIIATDLDDARRQAQGAGQLSLAQLLYQTYEVQPGKLMLQTGHIMLVS